MKMPFEPDPPTTENIPKMVFGLKKSISEKFNKKVRIPVSKLLVLKSVILA